MWVYRQQTGELFRDGLLVAKGYSGADDDNVDQPDDHKNNPAEQEWRSVGPIPRGKWLIEGPPFTSERTGPYVLRLSPNPDTDTFGRGDFEIHGDSKRAPGTASRGCIVLPRPTREAIWASGDHTLLVVA